MELHARRKAIVSTLTPTTPSTFLNTLPYANNPKAGTDPKDLFARRMAELSYLRICFLRLQYVHLESGFNRDMIIR